MLASFASFASSDGFEPNGGLLLVGNNLYGTAQYGGNSSLWDGWGGGTVFSVPLSGGAPTVLATFNGADGENPSAGLTVSGGTLYGTTTYGGPGSNPAFAYSGSGVVFSLPLSGGVPKVLGSFNAGAITNPSSNVVLGNGTLYGECSYYSGGGDGGIFSLPVSGGTPTVLWGFNSGIGTAGPPSGIVILSGNTVYGTGSAFFGTPLTGGVLTLISTYSTSYSYPSEDSLTGLAVAGNTLYASDEYGGVYGDGANRQRPVKRGRGYDSGVVQWQRRHGPTRLDS